MINGQISHWWRSTGGPDRRAPLPGTTETDVAIVGAGYTGLWTAYYLKKAKPTLRVVVLEAQHVGYGASGRNGGWLTNSITGGRAQFADSHGRGEAERFQLAMNDTIDEVIRVAADEGIDADIVKGGEYNVAYTPAQEARARAEAASESAWTHTDVRLLEREEALGRLRLEGTRAATWHPHAARIHPAKLVRGLAEAVERLGVEIYEGTRALEIRPHRVITDRGDLRAEFVVRATEGYTAGLKGLRRLWLPMNSSMIVTEPLPAEFWDAVGWQGREVVGDFAHVYIYAQRTADDRIAIGGRGVPYRWGSRTDVSGETARETVVHLRRVLRRLLPETAGTQIDHTWSGVLGVPRDWTATVGLDRASGIGWAGGYVGTGVATTNLSGRTLTELILGGDGPLSGLPWVDHRVRLWEPEPLRWIATHGLYAAYGMADRSESRGRATTSPIATAADVVTGRH
ncbi:FAD-dependent oxidoreductase [Schumannella luteola]|uniref:Glycine/D-amino acid oxidase-like deaminating enzyme n=1 Tax=Schumannella luteola TaxID=472059 RepID=A0A852YHC3_9MICO|nr:glycine/D-amino acid oxidase-like deaminating enzyme [Schumannella luteola]TPX05631.1 FAD-dependent oxidoreductase [Schumannella luteola]